MNIGDRITILRNGNTYSTYKDAFTIEHMQKYTDLWLSGDVPEIGAQYIVIDKISSSTFGRNITLIQCPETGQVFLMNLSRERSDYYERVLTPDILYKEIVGDLNEI